MLSRGVSMTKCRICGKEFEGVHYGAPFQDICSSECFNKNFWFEKIKNQSDPRQIVINGNCYYVGDEDSSIRSRGFDGTRFVIKKNNGEEVVTTNLWFNGKIPDEFRDQLPDNASWVKGEY